MRKHQVKDLFYVSWEELRRKPQAHAETCALQATIGKIERGSTEYGVTMIAILRRLRKNPRLVDRLNVEQSVDIYNSMSFLDEPWFFFPGIKRDWRKPFKRNWKRPADHLAEISFDRFIYADNEFTSFVASGERRFLERLAATLYQPGVFNKELVDGKRLQKLPMWKLQLIFFTFSHVREFIVKRCKTLLPSSAPAGDEQANPAPSGPLWHKIKHQAAETLVFGTFEELGNANVYSVLDHLEHIAKANVKS